MYKAVIDTAKQKMQKTLDVTKKELATLRAGRANPRVLDKIQVDYYGTMSGLDAVANISVPEPRMLVIAPWEPKMVGVIEKAILKSDLGITPSNDGKVIRLVFPELTEERRKDLCKQVRKQVEEGKVAIRSIRRDANDQIKKLKKDSAITEDDAKDAENELQKATDNAVKEADRISAEKEKEIMSV
ncbi:MAG: ribosome recycling factor [Clostridia bacterium]|nr:ribosome recycling factor [Clostridia bacterium]